jgi:RNase P subunit RPR2
MEKQSLDFLYEAAFKMMHTNPGLSRLYMIRYHHFAIENQFKIPFTTLKVFCHKCGTIFVPGQNCSRKVVEKVTEKTLLVNTRPIVKSDPVKEHILYSCSICTTTTQFYGRKQSELEPPSEKIVQKKKKQTKKSLLALLALKQDSDRNSYHLNDFRSS